MKNHVKLFKKTKLSYIISIPQIEDEGSLCFAEENNHLPMNVKRFYYILDVIKGAKRGFHAHKKNIQVLFCIKGSIKVILDNGREREEVILNKPNQGIFLDQMIWHEMVEFNKNTVLLVAASELYEESDYIRDYDTFLALTNRPRRNRFTQITSQLNHFMTNVLF